MFVIDNIWDRLPKRCSIKDLNYHLGVNGIRKTNARDFLTDAAMCGKNFKITHRGFEKL